MEIEFLGRVHMYIKNIWGSVHRLNPRSGIPVNPGCQSLHILSLPSGRKDKQLRKSFRQIALWCL